MRRIYVVVGELEDTNQIDAFDSAHLTMDQAQERAFELENEDNGHIWYWREVILEED
jgi:hypothetical protein